MAKWANATVLDGGFDRVRTQAAASAGQVKMHVIKAYAAADSYATVIGNSCAVVDMAAADYVQSSAGSDRLTTIAAKNSVSVTANSGVTPDLHIAHVDSVTSAVLYVTDDENTNQVLTAGNTVNIPAHTFRVNQPT
jgi:uncharacterized Rossmann fold enzyme